jgi:hypothetical protein
MSIAALLRSDSRFDEFRKITEQTMSSVLGLFWLEIWDIEASQMGDGREGVTVFVPQRRSLRPTRARTRRCFDSGRPRQRGPLFPTRTSLCPPALSIFGLGAGGHSAPGEGVEESN